MTNKTISDLPADTIVVVAQYLETLTERLNFRHTCSFVHRISGSHSHCAPFFSVDSNYGESVLLVMSLNKNNYVRFFESLPQRFVVAKTTLNHEEETDDSETSSSKYVIDPFTRFMLHAIMKGSSRMMEQYGFSQSKHITDSFFYCLMRCVVLDGDGDGESSNGEKSPLLDTLLHICKQSSSFWNGIDRLVGYVYPRLCFYQVFVHLSKRKRLSQLVNMLADVGINVPAIDFAVHSIGLEPTSSDDTLPLFYRSVPSFTTVHLAAWLRDYDTLEVMSLRFENSLEVETAAVEMSTPLYYCLRDPELYDVAIHLLDKFNVDVYETFETPDEAEALSNPLAKHIRDILQEKKTIPVRDSLAFHVTNTANRRKLPFDESDDDDDADDEVEDPDAQENIDMELLQMGYDWCQVDEAPRSEQFVGSSDEDSYEDRDEQGLDIGDLMDDDEEEIEDLAQNFERTVESDGDSDGDYTFGFKKVWINSRKPFKLDDQAVVANGSSGEQVVAPAQPDVDVNSSSGQQQRGDGAGVHGVVSRDEMIMPKNSFRPLLREVVMYRATIPISPCASLTAQRAVELAAASIFKLAHEFDRKKPRDAPLDSSYGIHLAGACLSPNLNNDMFQTVTRDIYGEMEDDHDDPQDSDFDIEMCSDVSSDDSTSHESDDGSSDSDC